MALRFIPPKLRVLLDTLSTADTGIVRRLFSSRKTVAIIEEIGRSAVPLAIPDLVPMALRGAGPILNAARSAIAALTAMIEPTDLPAFDLWMRTGKYSQPYWVSRFHSAWWSLRPDDVRKLAAGEHSPALLGVCSAHRNGYIREAAVEELVRFHDGRELGWLLIRVSDWVEPVREHAAFAVTERMRSEYASALVHWLPLILRL